jgi:hypothetical protein
VDRELIIPMTWTINDAPVVPETLQEYYGFCYLITNLKTNKKYVGRKYFTKAKTKQVKGKRKKIRVESDWIDYYGSNAELLKDVELYGKENFKREILHLCRTRGECSYYESKEILMRDCLLREDYYNVWLSCKIRRNHLNIMRGDLKK